MIANPTEFRAHLQSIFASSPLTVAGTTFPQEVTDEAIEEIIAAMVRGYMSDGGPTACERIVANFFIGLIEKTAR